VIIMNDLDMRDHLDLAEFANAAGQPLQPLPRGHAVARQTTTIPEVIGAQPVAVKRDEPKLLTTLKALAAAAGTDWFYRFPVKTKEGRDWIEGPSIKLANNVARLYGNCYIQVREFDMGDAFTFYARFTDLETGFSMERAYRQRKSQTSMRTKDADRALDITYQIGQSKAIRNVIVNALQLHCDFAFEEARNSLVEKIGKDLATWRERTLQGLTKIPVELVRAERAIGRSAKEWTASHVAQVIAMMKSVADGMATVEETFPPLEAPTAPEGAQMPDAPAGTALRQQPEGGAQSTSPGTGQNVNASADAAVTPPGDSAATDPLAIAHKRGQEAKAAGHARKAIPGEYRDAQRRAEADAWLAGHDGASLKGLV